MRRAIIFLILLLIMTGITLTIYAAYVNHQQIIDLADLSSNSRSLDSDGNFTGRFKPSDDNKKISSFTYEVVDDDLYITVYVGASAMECDEEGFVTIEISGLPTIDKVYYDNGEAKTVMPTDRE